MKSKMSMFVFFFLCLFVALNAQDIKIINSTNRYLILEFSPASVDTFSTVINGQNYYSVKFSSSFTDERVKPGQPDIQSVAENIGVPSSDGITISILSSHYFQFEGKIIPLPALVKDNGISARKYEESSDYQSGLNSELVGFGEFGLIGRLPVQSIKINPVEFDAERKRIRVYDKIVFRINFPASSNTEILPAKESEIYGSIINYSVARNWATKRKSVLRKGSANSLLASGVWKKFTVDKEGIYKIDRTTLSSMGIDVNNVDPRTIRMFNNGGYQLPAVVSESRTNELDEIAIYISGESDGKFDAGDYILFYGRTPDFFEYNGDKEDIARNKNFYTKKNYYWITAGDVQGKRIGSIDGSPSSFNFEQTKTRAFVYQDDDRFNLMKSGVIYLGDEFSSSVNSQTYINTLTERTPGSDIKYRVQFVSASERALQIKAYENDNQVYSGYTAAFSWQYSHGELNDFSFSYNGDLPQNRSALKFKYFVSDASDHGYMDYYEIEYERNLKSMNDELILFSDKETGRIKYSAYNFSSSDIHIFDVSDYANVAEITDASISGGQVSFAADESSDKISKYIICVPANYLKVKTEAIESVSNSNIRGITDGADLLIIGHKSLETQINRFAEYKENESLSKISTQIIYIDEIFNEFGGGSDDPTAIRDAIKYAFENWNNPPEFVLLFGDGEYDYLGVEASGKNLIPAYETAESYDEVYAYPYDDYYARVSGDDYKLDVAIGRFPVSSPSDAEDIINKIIKYEQETEKGVWQTNATLLADDAFTTRTYEGALHVNQSEGLGRDKIPDYFKQEKIYLSLYPTVQTALGKRKPAVNQAIVDAINNGTLIFNFYGHGNPEIWTHEVVYENTTTIPLLKNDELFFLTAATCDFGQWDYPNVPSGAEQLFRLPDYGAIGTFTASRPVYSGQNDRLNKDFYSFLLMSRDADNLPYRVSAALMNAKNKISYHEQNDEKFHIFCDPTLRLRVPRLSAEIDSVNGQTLDSDVQIKALSSVSIKGKVLDEQSNLLNGDGEVVLTVFDSEKNFYIEEMKYTITEQGGVIFRGRASVENGGYSAGFVVPKDISYENRNGKIVSYFLNDEYDGVGSTDRIVVGGADTTAIDDKSGPVIDIYFDDMSFDNSYLVNKNFTLLVKLADETGLNTTGAGVGHLLDAVINGDEENPIDLTNYFIGDLDANGKSGVVKYKFSNLEPGVYNISVRAWDVFNNNSQSDATFTVVESDEPVLKDVVNYPNPFASSTTFTFQRNTSDPISVSIKIYTIAGRMINQLESFSAEKFVKVDWDGRDNDGNLAANGTYFYKVIVKSTDGSYSRNVLGKLAIIR